MRKTKSRDGAYFVANFFQEAGDFASVIEFYLLAGMREDAFNMAQTHHLMEHYSTLIGDKATKEECKN